MPAGTYTVLQQVNWSGWYNDLMITLAFTPGPITPNLQQQYALDYFLVPNGQARNPFGETGPFARAPGAPPIPAAGSIPSSDGLGGLAFLPAGAFVPPAGLLSPHVAPADLALTPLTTGTATIFAPSIGTRPYLDTLSSANAVAVTDFSLYVDSNPTGTQTVFDAITYTNVAPYGSGWHASTSLVDSTATVTVAVDVFVERLTRSSWRKRIVLNASAATTVRIRQAHSDHGIKGAASGAVTLKGTDGQVPNAMVATFNRGIGAAAGPGHTSPALSVTVGIVRPDAWLSAIGPICQLQTLESGTLANSAAWFAVNAGITSTGGKLLALPAHTPVEVSFIYFAARSDQHPQAIASAVGEAHRQPPDLFKRVMLTTARSCYSRTSDTDASIFCVPGGAYPTNTFMRDSTWTAMGLDDPERARLILKKFAALINGGGQPPTNIPLVGAPTNFGVDDTAALFLICMAWLANRHGIADPGADLTDLTDLPFGYQRNSVLAYLQTVINASGYAQFGGFPDSYTPSNADSLCYSTGLGWVGLRAGQQFGTAAAVTNASLALSAAAYQSYWNGSYLDYSRSHTGAATASSPIVAPSVLAGEFFAQILYGTALLTDAQVAGHLDKLFSVAAITLPGGQVFKTMCNPDGSYLLPANYLNSPDGGNYQNGGAWLLWDFIACAVGKLHGYTNTNLDVWWSQRRAAEIAVNATSHEYINTVHSSGTGYDHPLGTSNSWTYGWNTLCAYWEDALGFQYKPIPLVP